MDPITLTVIGLVVTVVVALIPFVFPVILEWGKAAFDFIVGAVTGKNPNPSDGSADDSPPPEASLTDWRAWMEPTGPGGLPPALIVGALAVLAVVVVKKGGF